MINTDTFNAVFCAESSFFFVVSQKLNIGTCPPFTANFATGSTTLNLDCLNAGRGQYQPLGQRSSVHLLRQLR
jgi:hypothetical protein